MGKRKLWVQGLLDVMSPRKLSPSPMLRKDPVSPTWGRTPVGITWYNHFGPNIVSRNPTYTHTHTQIYIYIHTRTHAHNIHANIYVWVLRHLLNRMSKAAEELSSLSCRWAIRFHFSLSGHFLGTQRVQLRLLKWV